jgi:hypothetical protein
MDKVSQPASSVAAAMALQVTSCLDLPLNMQATLAAAPMRGDVLVGTLALFHLCDARAKKSRDACISVTAQA